MKTYLQVVHITVDLRLRHQSRHGVNDHDIKSAGTDHRLSNLQRLLAVIRLGNVKVINIHANLLGILRIKSVFRVNKSGNTVSLLCFSNHM